MKTRIHIIGAGPYGISLAETLYQQGTDFVLTGIPFDLWMNHTLDTMSIRSDRHASEIYSPDGRFGLTDFIKSHYQDWRSILDRRLPVSLFREYLRSVENSLQFPVKRCKVIHLEKRNGMFYSTLDDSSIIESHAVVLATGIEAYRYLPESLKNLGESGNLLHGYQVKDYAELQSQSVLVTGSGQSAAEAIAHLSSNNRITWLFRKDPVFYSEPINLPKPLFNFFLNISSLFYRMPDSLKKRLGRQFTEVTITPDMKPFLDKNKIGLIHDDVDRIGLVRTGNGFYSEKYGRKFDVIVAATGYQYHLNAMKFLDPALTEVINQKNGIPQLQSNFQTSVPELFMIGGISEPMFGPALRFMMGNRFAARTVSRALCS